MNQKQAIKIIEITKSTYELIGSEFSNTRNRIWPEMKMLVKKYVKSNDNVLDIGCGNGRLIEILSQVNYLGIDGSKSLIDEARKKMEIVNLSINKQGLKLKINFKNLDILELNKLDGKNFDVVFMFASFNHIPSEELRLKVLNDIKSLLKPNGLLVMTNWNMWQIGVKKNIWNYKIKSWKSKVGSQKLEVKSQKLDFKDVMTVWRNGAGNKQGALYYRAFTKRELKRLFKKSGFKMLENYYSLDNKKVYWGKGKNIVSAVKIDKIN